MGRKEEKWKRIRTNQKNVKSESQTAAITWIREAKRIGQEDITL